MTVMMQFIWMRIPVTLAMGCLLTMNVAAQDRGQKELIPVPFVDLGRYVGTWYEIARLPNRFQKNCSGDVTATYTLLDDGDIKVVNRCRQDGGEYTSVEGLARGTAGDRSNARLTVRFAPAFLSFLPFVWGDYWIIDLAADYSYAVVGEPDREYLWILARLPVMDEDTLSGILERVRSQGYDTTSLIRTGHTR